MDTLHLLVSGRYGKAQVQLTAGKKQDRKALLFWEGEGGYF